MKTIKKILMLLVIAVTLFAFKGMKGEAAAPSEISVNIPTVVDIAFQSDGTTSVSELFFENHSLVPVKIQSIHIAEFNEWEVVRKEQEILVNSKQLSLLLGEMELLPGSNPFYYEVAEGERYDFGLTIKRGAWTRDSASEKALEIEFQYEIGTKEFALTLDANGGEESSVLNVENGSIVSLPTPTREGYHFDGWQDENGNVYTGTYIMPIGEARLTARWKEIIAYAIYSADDKSFRFVQSVDVIRAGDIYEGRKVTAVYTGFEEQEYKTYDEVPWYADEIGLQVTKVYVEDEIQPISMENWFYHFNNCSYFDVTKIDTSNTISLHETFRHAGREVKGSFKVVGLENWDVSKVTNFSYLFDCTALFATSFDVGDLGGWDVSSATTLTRMFSSSGLRASTYRIGNLSNWNTANVELMGVTFSDAGKQATWYLDCSKWNVNKVSIYTMFNDGVEDKVKPPKWVL